MMIYLQAAFFSTFGSFAIAKVMNAPKQMAYFAGLIGGISFTFNTFLLKFVDNTISIFFATILIVVLAELLARIYNYPATIFIFPSLAPLLPGVKLYQTIMSLTIGDLNNAFKIGGQTILIALAIAMALVVSNTLTRKTPLKENI